MLFLYFFLNGIVASNKTENELRKFVVSKRSDILTLKSVKRRLSTYFSVDKRVYPCYARPKSYFSFHSDLTVCLGMVSVPLISLEKYSNETGGVHHMDEKSECGRHIRHRKETRGLSVGSDGVDTRKKSQEC